MDKFVKVKDSHTSVKITSADRARQYPKGTLHADSGLLFCSACNVVIDHTRKYTIDKHLNTSAHIQKSRTAVGKQQTLKTSFECKTPAQSEKIKICQEWIKACCAANIPLHKSDNKELRNFLQSRVTNGGAIPKCSQLRDYYLFDVFELEKAELKERLQGKNVALMVDELSDDEGRYVLDVMAVILDFDELSPAGRSVAYLLDTHFLTAINNKTVSQAVVRTVNEFGIDFDSVRVFNSDNVAYMKKAFKDTLSNLFPLAVHITCNSHIINLVAGDFKKKFTELNEFIKCFRNLFFIPSGRKSRLLNFLQRRTGENARMPPNPMTKKWSAWFDSAIYFTDNYQILEEFIADEIDRGRSSASASLLRLEEIYDDPAFMKKLHAELALVKIKAPTLLSCLNFFQEAMPHVTAVHETMGHLLYFLLVNAEGKQEDFEFCFEDGPYDYSSDEKAEILVLAKSAFKAAHTKLSKYVIDGAQPASQFLEQVRVLDPKNLVDCDRTYGSIDSVPGMDSVSREEWNLYVNKIAPQAVKNINTGQLDLKEFWKAKAVALPELYKIASTYCTTTIGSYDVERSFSAYNDILDAKRRSLAHNSMKAFHFLNWNLRVKSVVEEEMECTFNDECCMPLPEKKKKRSATEMGMATSRDTEKSSKKDAGDKARPSSGTCKPESSTHTNPAPSIASQHKLDKSTSVMDGRGLTAKKFDVSASQNREATAEDDHEPTAKKCKVFTSQKSNAAAKKGKQAPGKTFRSVLKGYFSNACKKNKDPNADISKSKAEPAVHFGLDAATRSKLQRQTEASFCFPEHKEPLLKCLLDGAVKFNSHSSIIDEGDLQSLLGGHLHDDDNYLNNFVIDAHLKLLAETTEIKAEVIEWETFENAVGKKPAKEVFKATAPLLDQDAILVPCNPGRGNHWFLLVVLPKEKRILALDSKAGAFIKPTVESAIRKMWHLLEELSPNLDSLEWGFSCNSEQGIGQQDNGFDCGVFVCLYARCLLLESPVVTGSQIISGIRKLMIVELHDGEIHRYEKPAIVKGKYYAVQYTRRFYVGRAMEDGEGSLVKFKFLYSAGALVFDWPKRDDIERFPHASVFYGPIGIVGNGPFTVTKLAEIEEVYRCVKKSQK